MDANRFAASQTEEGRYRLLVEAITDYAIYMLDVDGLVSSWNPGAQRFKGYTADEIVGRHFSRFYTDEDRAAGVPDFALRTARDVGRFEAEGWRVRKDGTRFWAHVVIDPIKSPDGDLIGFAKITRDLTERAEAERVLRQSQEQFRLLIEGVVDYAIYMLDPDGRVVSWNTGAQRIKGYTAAEAIGRHFSDFYTEEDRNAGLPAKGLATAAREGRWEQEGWRVRKTGERFLAHVILDAVRDDVGRLIGFAKVTRDVTERVEAQQALEATREALFQSQKLEAIGQLTGGIAHDFNNLLMAVLGSLELVKKRMPEDERITPLLDNAVQAARRGATLTQRMLAFARKQELALQSVNLADTVNEMRGLMQHTIGPTVRIETRVDDNLPCVRTDRSQLDSALLNLAVNARDAMPDGGVITITAERRRVEAGESDLEAGEYVRLCVSDTGEGMDEATLARATDPFFTTKGVGKGTGLGLSMVHGLAAQSGGSLRLHSSKGRGATVEIWLPAAGPAREAAPEAPERFADEPAAHGRRRILAVDDDALVLVNMAAMLDDLGHQVVQATSGQEAIRLLAEHNNIDLVITDHAMPGMTGQELAERLEELHPGLPVVIATGYAEIPAAAARARPRLAKPFTQDDLAAAVQAALDPVRGGRRKGPGSRAPDAGPGRAARPEPKRGPAVLGGSAALRIVQ